jgi:hypothetical protein
MDGRALRCVLHFRKKAWSLSLIAIGEAAESFYQDRRSIGMNTEAKNLSNAVVLATCLTLGCTGSGMAGCGSDDGGGAVRVDSDLIGVYAIDSFRTSPTDPTTGDPIPDRCDQLADAPTTGSFVVLYGFRPNDDLEEVRLGGMFCNGIQDCQEVAARAPEPRIGYSFVEGSDESGWTGYAISRRGATGDNMCRADVQVHTLGAAGQQITINTDAVETTFEASIEGDQATCNNRDALDSLTADLPCKARFVLVGTRQADL